MSNKLNIEVASNIDSAIERLNQKTFSHTFVEICSMYDKQRDEILHLKELIREAKVLFNNSGVDINEQFDLEWYWLLKVKDI